MSDERQASLVAFFTERHHHSVRPPGSLKRKLGQTIPISRQERVTYPSPPMSAPPSPSRPSPRPASSLPLEQQPAPSRSSLPASSSEQPSLPVTSAESQPGPPSFFGRSAEPPTTFISRTIGEPSSSGLVSAFPTGQNVFNLGQTAPSGPTLTSPTQPRSGRKAKAHVASACMNCKRAHLSCDTQRPCTRCVTSGKQVRIPGRAGMKRCSLLILAQDTCFDVPHKKRGRPRLREESEFKVEQMPLEQSAQTSVRITPGASGPPPGRPIARTRHQRTESLRSLRSQTSEGSSGSSLPTPGYPPILQHGWAYQAPRRPSSGMPAPLIPTAFLDLDFNFIRANRPFQQILSNDQDVRGRQLQDLAAPMDGESFVNLRGRLKGERESREPAYMPPILQAGEDPIQGVMEDDIERLASGFFDQTYTWTRAAPGPHRESFPARVRLAKATAYFVVVTLPSFRPVEMLPPHPMTSVPPPGFMIPPPRAPTLPSQPSDPRIETQSAPPGPFYPQPGLLPGTPQQFFPSATNALQAARTYPAIQPHPPGQAYPPTAQRPLQPQQQHPSTPRLPTAEPPMQITPLTPLTTAAAPRPQLAPSVQLPPLTGTPGSRPAGPVGEVQREQQQQQQTQSDDDDESPKKRRRMDISDVLQR